MRRDRKKRKYIIIALTIVLFIMSAGYAAFQTNLKISGTTRITSNWDVRITNVTEGTPTGTGENTAAPTWDNLTAYMKTKLYKKGDAMEYDVTISNRGTVDATLNSILEDAKTSNPAVIITFSGYTKGERLAAGQSKIVKVKIEFDSNYKGQIDYSLPAKTEVTFNYVQGKGSTTNPNHPAPAEYLITYNYEENGGTSSNTENEYLESTTINLTQKTATKEGYIFVGWNTNKNATEGLNTITLNQDTTLYAIFKKQINITYTKSDDITSIGKQSDSCIMYNNAPSCDVILPSITPNVENTKTAWYDNNMKIGIENGTLAISSDMALQAKYFTSPMIKHWEDFEETDFHNYDYKQSIISVEVLDNTNIPETATESWDVSAPGYNGVMAWIIPDEEDETKYHLYIGGEDGVTANLNSSYMFYGFSQLQTADLSKLNTENVTNMSYMFFFCQELTELDLSNFNTTNVTDMSSMFSDCANLTELDLSNFNTTNVTDMRNMFYAMTNLKTIYASENFTTSKVEYGYSMFSSDTNLVGGYGTAYNYTKETHTMAKIDKEGQEGYFTDKNKK